MSNTRIEIIDKLEECAAQTIALFSSLTSEQLEQEVYQDGARWRVRQVLAHFITIERSMQFLFKDILAGGTGGSEGFDIERFNRSQPAKLDGKSMDELTKLFSDVRRETISIVDAMSDEDLQRQGVHAFHGHDKLERFIRWAYEHAELHERDIKTIFGLK